MGCATPAGTSRRCASSRAASWTVVEKILAADEQLPADWDVDGTTGYEYCRRVTGLHIDPRHEDRFTTLYVELTGEDPNWESVSRQARRDVLAGSLSGDLDRLTRLAVDAGTDGTDTAQTREDLEHRLATSPVYRRYPGPDAPDAELRFEQLCAAVTAKGVEDTAFYRYTRFVALNEVGSEPGRWGCSPEEFHSANQRTLERWPLSLTATATHDTKWGEDVRARLCVLSEVPDEWAEFASRWMSDPRLSILERFAAYGLLQALVGAWPLPFERAETYLRKAMREAKSRTSWSSPDEAFEESAVAAVAELLADSRFVADLAAFARPVARWGRAVSLSTLALKLMSPGVPDIYQGTELWDDSLVDPDNRRPVDFQHRRKALASLDETSLLAGLDAGLPKFRLLRAGLDLRRSRPEAFSASSSYEPLAPQGPDAESVVAFSRSEQVLLVAPRLLRVAAPESPNAFVALPAGEWTDVLSGRQRSGKQSAGDLWSDFPVAVLVRRPSDGSST